MKFAPSLALLLTAALISPSALANFHIMHSDNRFDPLIACPSNYDNCICMRDGKHGVQSLNGETSLGDAFSLNGGLCGMSQMNFYKRSDGHWDFYVNNGDGSLQGTCYSNTATNECYNDGGAIEIFNDELVCYSYICEP